MLGFIFISLHGLSYFILNTYAGAAMSLVAVIRNAIFMLDKKIKVIQVYFLMLIFVVYYLQLLVFCIHIQFGRKN